MKEKGEFDYKKLKHILKICGLVLEAILAIIGTTSIAVKIQAEIKDNQTIIGSNNSIDVDNIYDDSQYKISNYNIFSADEYAGFAENEILHLADKEYRNKNIEAVLNLYSLSQVCTSSVMLCNKAYIYENGIGVDCDIEMAIECLKKADTVCAKRNLLAIYIQYFDDKETEITQLLNDLAERNDNATLEYVTLCNYELTLDKFYDKYGKGADISYNLQNFHQWEFKSTDEWINKIPQDYPGLKYEFASTHYGEKDGYNYIGYYYKKYGLKYIEKIQGEYIYSALE